MFRFLSVLRQAPQQTAQKDDLLSGLAASERLSHLVLLTF